jgi:dGTPase
VDLATFEPTKRLTDETVPEGDDRSHFRRDRDIILYTSAFKRLSGVTQVVSPETGHAFHNRLTHTLQVAQVGRSLAEKLHKHFPEQAKALGLDPDVVEASCLAHDLGHPPFGHVGEETLNKLMGEEAEGFEGNAQSFRIVSELAFRSANFVGLNLTRGTLRAILKYPWTYAKRPQTKRKKWGAYQSEIVAFEHATGDHQGGPAIPAPESRLMDWADDLTYSVHDVEDFYRAGLIPLHLLRPAVDSGCPPDKERDRFLQYVWSRRDSLPEINELGESELDRKFAQLMATYFRSENAYDGTREQRSLLRTFTGRLVNRYINGSSLSGIDEQVALSFDKGLRSELAILKQLTWCYVIERPGLAVQQHFQKQAIRYLFGVFRNEVNRSPSNLLPPYYQQRLRDIRKIEGAQGGPRSKRLVCDLIAGMTEHQATVLYQRLNGIAQASGLDNLLM